MPRLIGFPPGEPRPAAEGFRQEVGIYLHAG